MADPTRAPLNSHQHSRFLPFWILLSALIMVATALIEYAMGRNPICKCGYITFWVGDVRSDQLSQQIADWYSFSHIIHGLLFYGLLYWLLRRRFSVGERFVLAILIEAGWEILENSPFIIERYRQTAAQGYTGDSIVNSVGDILFCVLGFFLRYLPVWVSIALIVIMEIGVGYRIHDNLTLNIIMLLHPFPAIKHWQMGRL